MRPSHGGNIYLLAERLGIRDSEIIDFSASINPLGVPESVQSAMRDSMKCLFNYPDPDTKRLRLKIAEHIGVDPASIICGNGSTELIYLIVRALRPARVLLPAPTFSEYERACRVVRRGGATPAEQKSHVSYFMLKQEDNFDIDAAEFISVMSGKTSGPSLTARSSSPFDMAFLCNPNNPTGRLIGKEEMVEMADAARELKCALVVDEAFIDFSPDATIVEEVAKNPYLIVLRSMTKIYALSGLRIGYAVLPSPLMDIVKEAKEPWTVNTLAQVAGIAALDDVTYRAETSGIIEREKKNLEEGFRRMGISYLPSAVNYYLLKIENAKKLAAFLKEKGILVRDCSNFTGLDSSYIRIAVKSQADNERLMKEISSCRA